MTLQPPASQQPLSGNPGFAYDAFLSYSTAGDYTIARRVESFLEGFHKAVATASAGIRPLHVCRDGSDFRLPRPPTPGEAERGLWALVEAQLKKCRTLIVICSEDSVDSAWVAREIEWMLDTRGDASVLLAISGSSDPIATPERIFPAPVRRRQLERVRVWYDLRALRGVSNARVRDAEDELVRLAGDLLGWDDDRQGSLGAIWLREETRRRRKQARRWSLAGVAMVALGSAAMIYAYRATRAAAQARANAMVVAAEASRDPLVASLVLEEITDRDATNDALRVANDVGAMRIPIARLYGHTGRLLRLKISPDEKLVLSAAADGDVRLWPLNGKGDSRILAHYSRGDTWAGFGDASTVLSGGADGTVSITNTRDSTHRQFHLPIKDAGITRVESTPAGLLILASDGSAWTIPEGLEPTQLKRVELPSGDHALTVCHVAEGLLILTAEGSVWRMPGSSLQATRDLGLSLSPSELAEFGVNAVRFGACAGSDAVAFAGDPMTMLIDRGSRGRTAARVRAESRATSMAASADGRRLALGNTAGEISVYKIPTLERMQRFETGAGFWTNDQLRGEESGVHPQPYAVNDIVISASGDVVVATYDDWITRVWHVNGSAGADELRGQVGADRLTLSDRQQFVATGADDGSLRVWSLDEKTEPKVLEHPQDLYTLAVDYGERVLATGDGEGSITLWSLDDDSRLAVLPFAGVAKTCPAKTPSASTRTVALTVSKDAGRVLSAYANGALSAWNIKHTTQPVLETTVCVCNDLKTGAVIPGGGLLASCTDGTLSIWNGGPNPEHLAHGPASQPTALAAADSNGPFLVGYANGEVRAWRNSTSEPVAVGHPAHTAQVFCAGITPDGRTMLTTSQDGFARLWREGAERPAAQATDVEKGKWMENCLILDKSGLAVIASETGRTWLWPLNGGSPRMLFDRTATAHVGSILSLAWLPEQGLVATGGGVDGDIRLWNIKTMQPEARFSPGDGAITGLWPIRKGAYLISIGEDRRAGIWPVPWSEVIGLLRERTSANLTQIERARLLGEDPKQARRAFELSELRQGRSPLPEDFFFRIPF
jgi:WD40 repeat protein